MAPYTAVLTKLPQRQDGYRDEIALFVCPVEPETSRVWFRMAVTDHDSSDDELRAFQHTIFTQDQPVLESQRPQRLPRLGGRSALRGRPQFGRLPPLPAGTWHHLRSLLRRPIP